MSFESGPRSQKKIRVTCCSIEFRCFEHGKRLQVGNCSLLIALVSGFTI